jgi:hypothetical protein
VVGVFHLTDPSSGDRRPAGVVTADLSMDQLTSVLERVDLGPSGYPALTTREGRYLYHPNSEYVARGRSLVDVASETGDQDRVKLAEQAMLLWYAALTWPPGETEVRGDPVGTRATLARVQDTWRESSREANTDPPRFVPTGVVVDELRFESPNDIVLSGFL